MEKQCGVLNSGDEGHRARPRVPRSTLLSFYAEQGSKRSNLAFTVGGTGWNVIGRSLFLPNTCKSRRGLVTLRRLTFRKNSSAQKEKSQEPLSEEVVLPLACIMACAARPRIFSVLTSFPLGFFPSAKDEKTWTKA